ncbi:ZIP family metal transporter [Lujinxingia litoralis]|uniref:ZIP family metal transporter n=1 Tax=Lujinxingia litoralis TaxID=2211119 RepID=A0A328C1N4_9DELT|nr:ZIP family metal transporter [Lujinxingia litoralis]RAL20199.1 ZIP family metal transporter [Lujinxingia litoralis]
MPEWVLVLVLATITALATGLGPLPLIWVEKENKTLLAHGTAIAAGLMLSASFNLVNEGIATGVWRTTGGLLIGLVFIYLSDRWLEGRDIEFADLQGAGATQALIFLGVMTLHSFAEGISVGVAFGGGQTFGVLIAIAIAVHNIPEGLAIGVGMVPRGMPWWKASLWSIFSSLPQPLLALPAYLFVETFRPALPVGLGIAAGAMIWMVVAELIPNALQDGERMPIAATLTVSVAAMTAFQALFSGM